MTAARPLLLRAADHRRMPWKNGGGTTAEILIEPPGGGDEGRFTFRLSLAQVERSGPFSVFPGCDRALLLLSGEGMDLDFGAHGEARVDRPFAPLHFPGDWPARCTLLGGPVQDLNLIVDRARAGFAVRVLPVGAAELRCALLATTALLFSLRGDLVVSAPPSGDPLPLAPGETLRLDAPGAEIELRADGAEALVYVVELRVR